MDQDEDGHSTLTAAVTAAVTCAPTQYEWRRPDGNVLFRLLLLDWMPPPLWPFRQWPAPYEPMGPVQVWRQRPGAEPELVAETPDGLGRLVIYENGRAIPVLPD